VAGHFDFLGNQLLETWIRHVRIENALREGLLLRIEIVDRLGRDPGGDIHEQRSVFQSGQLTFTVPDAGSLISAVLPVVRSYFTRRQTTPLEYTMRR